jgi:ribosome-binding factor A
MDICSMESKRQQKFARLLQKDLGEIFQKEARELFEGAFITVTEVKVTPDLALARVYLSFMMAKDKQRVLDLINDHLKQIRNLLGQRIRHQVRIVPDLQFFADDTAEYVAKIEELFSKIDIPPATEDYKLDNYKGLDG